MRMWKKLLDEPSGRLSQNIKSIVTNNLKESNVCSSYGECCGHYILSASDDTVVVLNEVKPRLFLANELILSYKRR